MPIKDWQVGERPTASDLNRYFMQQAHVIKSIDESIVSSTTLQDDDHLVLSVQASTDYWVQSFIIYDAAAGLGSGPGDLKIGWTVPSGASWDWVSDSLAGTTGTTVDVISRSAQTTGTPGPRGAGTGTNVMSVPKGILRVGANAGTIRLRWAQLTSSATATRVRSGSLLMIRRLTT